MKELIHLAKQLMREPDRQKELLTEFAEAGDASPTAKSWYDRIKGLFDAE